MGLVDKVDKTENCRTWGTFHRELMNGENPYQIPAAQYKINTDDKLALHKFEQISGEAPCFTNIADFDSILHCMSICHNSFNEHYGKAPYIAITSKHGNPCGLSIDWSKPQVCIEKALFGNPQAIWGGECITNFNITEDIAEQLLMSAARKEKYGNGYWMLHLVAAPGFDKKSIEILGKNSVRKLFRNKALYDPTVDKANHFRKVRGGILKQPSFSYILDVSSQITLTNSAPIEFLDSLIIAWSVAFSSFHGGNEIAIAKDRQLLGVAGGASTFDAAKTAVRRVSENFHNRENCVFAADAFFPFTDAPEVLKEAGCKYGIVPGGGKNFNLVKKYFERYNVIVFYLDENVRGFFRH